MIRDAVVDEKDAIYKLWQTNLSSQSGLMLDSFFKCSYPYGRCVVNEVDGKIVSTIFMQPFDLMLNELPLRVYKLSHLCTHYDYRRYGYMNQCLASVLDEVDKKSLFCVVEAFNQKWLEDVGFTALTYRRHYDLAAKYFAKISDVGISHEAEAEELAQVYSQFVKVFDGYQRRDLFYFARLLEMVESSEWSLSVYRRQSEIQGYVLYHVKGDVVEVEECVYLGSIALMKCLKGTLDVSVKEIHLQVSEFEHLEKIFPLAISRKRVHLMGKCMNLALFNKLYNSSAKNVVEAYNLNNKPKMLNILM